MRKVVLCLRPLVYNFPRLSSVFANVFTVAVSDPSNDEFIHLWV